MANVLAKIFSVGAKELVTSVTSGLDSLITNKEEKAAAKLAIEQEINRHLESLQASADKEIEFQYQDKGNARQRETEFVKATGHADWMQIIVGSLIMMAFFAGLIIIGFKAIPPGNEHIMINAIGILEGLVMSVASYYFGSSLGSKIKDMKK